MNHPKIAVTMGDPAGVGPEICLELLGNKRVSEHCVPIVFGDADVLSRCAEKTGKLKSYKEITRAELNMADAPSVLSLDGIDIDQLTPGSISEATGHATYRYLESAITACRRSEVDAVTTAPANKTALHQAGITQPGQTEIFAEHTGTDTFCMMLTSDVLTCSFVTVHVGYHEVAGMLTTERILKVIELTYRSIKHLRNREPQLAVCGLNPHAGEGGLFGNREEELIIAPAIERARALGMRIVGPLPPDTAFLPERRAVTDAFICMYHDQGHIPLKALAFDRAVNCTLGLPIIRTSVDHGTAFD
ncbi:MAG: 4-hydroxythreonine-4-phosphate dehydrogenase PdxA, partial [Roseibacillus sp. TMED18]